MVLGGLWHIKADDRCIDGRQRPDEAIAKGFAMPILAYLPSVITQIQEVYVRFSSAMPSLNAFVEMHFVKSKQLQDALPANCLLDGQDKQMDMWSESRAYDSDLMPLSLHLAKRACLP
jgi:hypothetical protein